MRMGVTMSKEYTIIGGGYITRCIYENSTAERDCDSCWYYKWCLVWYRDWLEAKWEYARWLWEWYRRYAWRK